MARTFAIVTARKRAQKQVRRMQKSRQKSRQTSRQKSRHKSRQTSRQRMEKARRHKSLQKTRRPTRSQSHAKMRQLAVSKPGGVLSTTTRFPLNVDQVIVISIRQNRWQDFRTRMGAWAASATRFSGCVDGRKIDRASLRKAKIIDTQTKLTKGQIGCFMSHVALWKHLCKRGFKRVLVCEDDAAIYNTKVTEQFLTQINAQMKKHPTDLIWIGHHSSGKSRGRISANLEWAPNMTGTFAYVATRIGLEKLLRIKMTPYRRPIDDTLTALRKHAVTVSRTIPTLCWVTFVDSDTYGIK